MVVPAIEAQLPQFVYPAFLRIDMLNATAATSTVLMRRLLITATMLVVLFASNARAQSTVPDEAMQEWLDPVTYGALENKTDPVRTTQAWIDCIADAAAKKKSIR